MQTPKHTQKLKEMYTNNDYSLTSMAKFFLPVCMSATSSQTPLTGSYLSADLNGKLVISDSFVSQIPALEYLRTMVCIVFRLSLLPQGHQARPEAQPASREAHPARPKAQPARLEA